MEGAPEQPIEQWAGPPGLESVPDLPENLALAGRKESRPAATRKRWSAADSSASR